MQARSQQLLLVAGASALTIALYFAPRQLKPGTGKENPVQSHFEIALNTAKGTLQRQEADIISGLESRLKAEPGNISVMDSLGRQWDALKKPAIAAHYFEEQAMRDETEKNWLNAAYRYFDAFQTTADSADREELVHHAIDAYKKVLAKNPSNLDAKTDLGICYAEGTSSPMEGITLLREVVAENPEHENAQFNLGVLSMRSGQYEKAADRFLKVLSINPGRKEMYLMAGRAYMLAGNSAKAAENFEKAKKESADAAVVAQANNYINQLSNH